MPSDVPSSQSRDVGPSTQPLEYAAKLHVNPRMYWHEKLSEDKDHWCCEACCKSCGRKDHCHYDCKLTSNSRRGDSQKEGYSWFTEPYLKGRRDFMERRRLERQSRFQMRQSTREEVSPIARRFAAYDDSHDFYAMNTTSRFPPDWSALFIDPTATSSALGPSRTLTVPSSTKSTVNTVVPAQTTGLTNAVSKPVAASATLTADHESKTEQDNIDEYVQVRHEEDYDFC